MSTQIHLNNYYTRKKHSFPRKGQKKREKWNANNSFLCMCVRAVPLPPSIQNVRALALSPDTVSVIWDDPIDYNYTITNYQVCRTLSSQLTRHH